MATPATTFKEVFPPVDAVFDSALAIADFMEKNKSKLQVSGATLTVTDPAVAAELNKMAQQLGKQSAAINAAQDKMRAVMRGS
ncbi:hypothetical protein FQZ97_1238530 [compost metagenome]